MHDGFFSALCDGGGLRINRRGVVVVGLVVVNFSANGARLLGSIACHLSHIVVHSKLIESQRIPTKPLKDELIEKRNRRLKDFYDSIGV